MPIQWLAHTRLLGWGVHTVRGYRVSRKLEGCEPIGFTGHGLQTCTSLEEGQGLAGPIVPSRVRRKLP